MIYKMLGTTAKTRAVKAVKAVKAAIKQERPYGLITNYYVQDLLRFNLDYLFTSSGDLLGTTDDKDLTLLYKDMLSYFYSDTKGRVLHKHDSPYMHIIRSAHGGYMPHDFIFKKIKHLLEVSIEHNCNYDSYPV